MLDVLDVLENGVLKTLRGISQEQGSTRLLMYESASERSARLAEDGYMVLAIVRTIWKNGYDVPTLPDYEFNENAVRV